MIGGRSLSSTYDITHENIMKFGLKHFTENGYIKTSLRELCKEVGITTGGFYRHFKDKECLFTELVKPALEVVGMIGQASIDRSEVAFNKNQTPTIWTDSEDVYKHWINSFYANKDAFKLLLCYSNGSKYENFIDDLSQYSTKATMEFVKKVYTQKGIKELPSEDELHILLTAMWRCLAEPIIHDFPIEKALSFCTTINKLFNWKDIFEF